MSSPELRKRFLEFFEKRGHKIVPSSSLVPDDSSVLLTTAGMQQFKPYFVGKADPLKDFGSLNTVSIQKSFRTSDIDEVGDERHLTFFEMMGNFSFGGYFKKEAITLAYDFLFSIGLKIQYATVFAGDPSTSSGQGVPKDQESKEIWKKLGVQDIREEGRADNFWGPTGNEGPCGPTSEIYINDTEIWNIVFNEYYCRPDGALEKLKTPGVDTGMGLERLAMVSQGKKHIFGTDLFQSIVDLLPGDLGEKKKRVLADHARAIAFLLLDGVSPSNKGAGYVLRRLMRRVIVYEMNIEVLLDKVVETYSSFYPGLARDLISVEFRKEQEKFRKTVLQGLNALKELEAVDAVRAFNLYQSFGIPFEVIKEYGEKRAEMLTREDFDKEFAKHQEISRAGKEKKFGGHGLLLDTGELKAADEKELRIVTRLHTATHLLQAALRAVLGPLVHQEGSDITVERTRFDFNLDRKLTSQEISRVESWINDVVEKNADMGFELAPFEKAIQSGALYSKKEKYPATVKIYTAQDPKTQEVFSKELCGGPHVIHTGEVGKVKIMKEEGVAAGIRRIRAILE